MHLAEGSIETYLFKSFLLQQRYYLTSDTYIE